jgi:hypothetical protein
MTLYLEAQNTKYVTCQSMANLSIKTVFTEKDVVQFLGAIFHKTVLKISRGMF